MQVAKSVLLAAILWTVLMPGWSAAQSSRALDPTDYALLLTVPCNSDQQINACHQAAIIHAECEGLAAGVSFAKEASDQAAAWSGVLLQVSSVLTSAAGTALKCKAVPAALVTSFGGALTAIAGGVAKIGSDQLSDQQKADLARLQKLLKWGAEWSKICKKCCKDRDAAIAKGLDWLGGATLPPPKKSGSGKKTGKSPERGK